MKKKLLLTLLSVYAATCGAADSDIVKGYDFTGATSITGAKLNQLVDNAYVGTNRGMIIFAVTNTAAAVTAEPKLARYLWLDSSFTPPVPKVWDATGGYWTNITANATLTAGSVTESILASGAVTESKLGAGAVVNSKLGDGSIGASKIQLGVITNSHIAEYTIQSTNIATNAIVSATIATAAVTGDKIAPGSIGTSSLTNGFLLAGTNMNIGLAGISPTNLAATPLATYVPRVNSAATAFEFVPPGLVQMVSTSRTDLVTCSTPVPYDDTVPTSTEGDEVQTVTITPKSAASTLVVTYTANVSANGAAYALGFILRDAGASAVSSGLVYLGGGAWQGVLTIRYIVVSGSTAATTFKVRVGPSAGITYVNGGNGARILGGSSQSILTVQEIY